MGEGKRNCVLNNLETDFLGRVRVRLMKITRGGPEWRLLFRKLNELTGGEAAILNFVLLL